MIAVAEITSVEQLAEYRVLWRMLQARTPDGSFFQTRESLEACLRSAASTQRLKTLVVCVGTNPVGIVPLVIRPLSTRLGTLHVLTSPACNADAVCGPIGPNPTATIVGALKHLATASRDWDILDLRGLNETGGDCGRTENAFRLANFPFRRRAWTRSALIDLSQVDIAAEYQFRRQLQQIERDFWKEGRWEHLQETPAASAPSELFTPLWEQLASGASESGQPVPAHIRDMAWAAACLNSLNIQLLKQNGRVVGSLLSVRGNNRVDILDVRYTTAAAANILVGRLLFDGVIQGEPLVVFGERWANLAESWNPEHQTTERFTHYSATQPRAQLLRIAQWFRPRLIRSEQAAATPRTFPRLAATP